MLAHQHWIQPFLSSLKACAQSLRKKPGMHHSMQSGSIARAPSTFPCPLFPNQTDPGSL